MKSERGERMFRIGQSSDIHRLTEGRRLVLGGVDIAHEKGLLGHSDADALVHAVAEAVAPYIAQMKNNLAQVLDCDPQQINVKATRGEGLGFVGREEGVLAQAVVLLEKTEEQG